MATENPYAIGSEDIVALLSTMAHALEVGGYRVEKEWTIPLLDAAAKEILTLRDTETLVTKWHPIETAKKDGTTLLLWYPAERAAGRSGPGIDEGGAIEGWWFSSPKEIDDGWETIIGFVGEPTHWSELTEPVHN